MFKFFIVHMIFLGPKKITSFIVDVINAHNKELEECCTDLQALVGGVTLVLSCNETHVHDGLI